MAGTQVKLNFKMHNKLTYLVKVTFSPKSQTLLINLSLNVSSLQIFRKITIHAIAGKINAVLSYWLLKKYLRKLKRFSMLICILVCKLKNTNESLFRRKVNFIKARRDCVVRPRDHP